MMWNCPMSHVSFIMYLIRNACLTGKWIRNQQCGDIKYYQKLDYLRL